MKIKNFTYLFILFALPAFAQVKETTVKTVNIKDTVKKK